MANWFDFIVLRTFIFKKISLIVSEVENQPFESSRLLASSFTVKAAERWSAQSSKNALKSMRHVTVELSRKVKKATL